MIIINKGIVMNKNGSITIFLAIVLLTLLSFVLSIYEVTRVQILDIEASQLSVFSGNSVLAAYDSTLKNEYGIFARNIDYSDLDFIYPDKGIKKVLYGQIDGRNVSVKDNVQNKNLSSDFAYYLGENLEGSQFISAEVEAKPISTLHSRAAREYLKSEILNYTKANIVLTKISQILESYDIFLKIGKTTDFEERKNKIISKAGTLESEYSKLYAYIDGVDVRDVYGQSSVNNYINRLNVSKRNPNNLPNAIQKGKYIDLISALKNYRDAYTSIIESKTWLKDLYLEFKPIDDEYDELSSDISDLDSDILELNKKIERYNKDLEKLSAESRSVAFIKAKIKSLKDSLKEFNLEKRNLQTYLSIVSEERERVYKKIEEKIKNIESAINGVEKNHFIFKALIIDNPDNISMSEDYGISSSSKDKYNSFLSNNKFVKNIIQEIRKNGENLGSAIDDFVVKEKDKKDDYIEGTYKEAEESLNKIKKQYGAVLRDTFDEKGNLNLMEIQVDNNIRLLEGLEKEVNYLSDSVYIDLAYEFKVEGLDKHILKELNSVTLNSKVLGRMISNLKFSKLSSGEYLEKMDELILALKAYKNVSGLSYEVVLDAENESFIERFKAMKKIYQDIYDNLNGVVSGKFLSSDLYRLPEDLPSLGVEVDEEKYKMNSEIIRDDISILDSDKSSKFFSDLLGNLSASDFMDKILISEYIICMFKAYSDNFLQRESMSGYKIKEHIFPTEIEYIISGIENPESIMAYVITTIYAMRMGVNIISLLLDSKKREEIIGFANAIAGWWSFGSGAIVMSVVITFLWASVESGIDIAVLIHGGKIPIIKTSRSWYSSLDGLTASGYLGLLGAGKSFVSENLQKIINEVPKNVMDLSSEMLGLVGDAYKENVSAGIDSLYTIVYDAFSKEIERLEYRFDDALIKAINDKREGKKVLDKYPVDGLAFEEKMLVDKAKRLVEKAEMDDAEYAFYVELKKRVKKELSEDLSKCEEGIKSKYFDFIDYELGKAKDEIKKICDVGQKEISEITKKRVDDIFLDINKKIKKKYGDVSGKKDSAFVPRFDYYDYLRLILLSNNDMDVVLDRTLDIIDLNISAKKSGIKPKSAEDLELKNYAYEIGFEADYKFGFKFFDISSALGIEKGDGLFNIRQKKVLVYEK